MTDILFLTAMAFYAVFYWPIWPYISQAIRNIISR